jgi:hypothetical protein
MINFEKELEIIQLSKEWNKRFGVFDLKNKIEKYQGIVSRMDDVIARLKSGEDVENS